MNQNLELVESVFRIRLLCLLGFMPKIEKCVNCNAVEDISFFSSTNFSSFILFPSNSIINYLLKLFLVFLLNHILLYIP